MSTIRVHDKEFAPSIPAEDIMAQVRRVAGEINKDYEGQQPLFLVVLPVLLTVAGFLIFG